VSAKLSDLVRRKMDAEHLSLRSAGAEAGVAHTTIDRVLKEESLDLETLDKVCQWLSVPVASVLELDDQRSDLLDRITEIVSMCPELSDVFSEIADKVMRGEIDQTILNEVAGFASYRLGIKTDT
jgi:transcriptional regulator with XRE-family HTH domain